ncbi:glycosyltransferase [Candidatus Marifrigoribacter sp. Uisw_064]|jgi:glycosyltransferase involved in cell wall biosynthesis|uniref:glycosyltransferase n=1 Tax=Candidatus Marifrigoribacter sp. Uisw_064 TaxID=3230970 RepID=UPI003AD874C0
MKLLVISHTRHYISEDGSIVGWGPTINELNNLIEEFDEIVHVAMLHSGMPPQSSLPYTSSKIKFVALPALGGQTIFSKLKMILNAPKIIRIVSKEIKNSDLFQLRTPTGIGVILIPFLTFFTKMNGWYKYAGNWKQVNKPLGYRLQKWMLKNQKRKVTINGNWENQAKNVLTFENPCLTVEDRLIGKNIVENKKLTEKKNYCFVGGLNYNKGIDKIIKAFKLHPSENIGTLHIVGDGELKTMVEKEANQLSINVKIHGSLPKNEVQEIYKNSHFILVPSKNEGFPKVIGEAMNFGCVPVVSNVSCIGQYVKNDYNGFLIQPNTIENLKSIIKKSSQITEDHYKIYIDINYKLANKFTYQYYIDQINIDIINEN